MDKNLPKFRNKVKLAFSKVKKDIIDLKKEIKENKELIKNLSNDLKIIFEKMNQIITKTRKNNDILQNFLIKNSTRNKGVNNNKQQQIITNNNKQQIITNNNKQYLNLKQTAKQIAIDLENKFKSLSDREFSLFITVYQLEKELGEVTYADIAKKLNLTLSSTRVYMNDLLHKNLPLIKERPYHGKVIFTIPKPFKDLNLINKLIKLKDQKTEQTSLFNL